MLAPSVQFETVDLNRPQLAVLRTDICGFIGYAERGPIDRPVKLRSWRQFLNAFGPPLPFAYLGESVRLYFENGGDTVYIRRVADPAQATAATLDLPGGLQLRTAFSAIGRSNDPGSGPRVTPDRIVSDSPGSWGNRLAVNVFNGGLGTTESLPNQSPTGTSLQIRSLAGFHVGSWVRLIQNGDAADTYARIAQIDAPLMQITFNAPATAPGLDFSQIIRLETVEFTLSVLLDGIEMARHSDLSLDPDHQRYAPNVLRNETAALQAVLGTVDLSDPNQWPTPANVSTPLFTGGRDGLASVTRQDFSDALEDLARVDEISILAAPDIVLRAEPPSDQIDPPRRPNACLRPEPLPEGVLSGTVIDSDSKLPVAGARISSLDIETRATLSDAAGQFTLTGLTLGQVNIRLEKAGYLSLDASTQAFSVAVGAPQIFAIAPRTLPPALHLDDIRTLQMEMANQGARGLYRIALLDVPEDMLRVEDLQGWRAAFDTSHAAMHWPWLITANDNARALPPSGAVAGLTARLDLAEGPQRAPANRRLQGVVALSTDVDDAIHGLLNAQGINVLRATPGRGIAPQGARTLSSNPEWRFLNVRRLMLMIAEAIEEGHQWAVFEPNNEVLRNALRQSLSGFFETLWRRGALAGAAPEAAFAIKIDDENNPLSVIDAGQIVADIAVAPVRPYEFIRLRLGRTDRLSVQLGE